MPHTATPIVRMHTPDGEDVWLVTRYDEVRTVLSDSRFGVAMPGMSAPEFGSNDSLFQNPPGHTRLRRLVAPTFGQRRVNRLRSRTAEIADELVGRLLEREPPQDLMEAFTYPLPITIIGDLLGVPENDRANFRAWSDTLLALTEPGTTDIDEAWQNLAAQVGEMITRKREHPGDDLLSSLIAARDEDSDRLSDPELTTMAITLITAGYVTTSTGLAMALVMLTERNLLARLADEPALVAPAVEEVLRYQGAAGDIARVAVEDVTINGVTIAAGEKVIVSLTTANRDERRFSDPDTFDITRSDNAHVTFGHGIHHCLGAALARVELQVALTTLASRVPTLRLTTTPEELPWRRSGLFGDEFLTALSMSW